MVPGCGSALKPTAPDRATKGGMSADGVSAIIYLSTDLSLIQPPASASAHGAVTRLVAEAIFFGIAKADVPIKGSFGNAFFSNMANA